MGEGGLVGMYLNERQVGQLLATPFFSIPFTENSTNYTLYRGRLNVVVQTFRFNVRNFQVNTDFMVQTMLSKLLEIGRAHV